MNKHEAILQLIQLGDQYQRQNKVDHYIDSLQQLYQLKREVYGEDSQEFQSLQQKLCTMLNHNGVVSLQKLEYLQSIDYLKRAEIYSTSQQQKVITYNNIACYYRKTGKIKVALNYLQQALSMELMLPQSTTLSDTYLNLCAVLSQQDRHEEAIQHIYLSIIMLQHELLSKTLGWVDVKKNIQHSFSQRSETHSQSQSQTQSQSQHQSQSKESETLLTGSTIQMNNLQGRVAVLVVAYHNLGVEMEFLKKNIEASKIFSSALSLAEQNLNKNHQMLVILKKLNNREVVDHEQVLKLNLPKLVSRHDRNKVKQRKQNVSTSPLSQKLTTKMSLGTTKRNPSTHTKKRPDSILFVPGISRYEDYEGNQQPPRYQESLKYSQHLKYQEPHKYSEPINYQDNLQDSVNYQSSQVVIKSKTGNLEEQQYRSIDKKDSYIVSS